MFLLIGGDNYYPNAGTEDWIGIYPTLEEAQKEVNIIKNEAVYLKKYKGKFDTATEIIKIKGNQVDWYEIVDLDNWKPSR